MGALHFRNRSLFPTPPCRRKDFICRDFCTMRNIAIDFFRPKKKRMRDHLLRYFPAVFTTHILRNPTSLRKRLFSNLLFFFGQIYPPDL